MGAQAPEGLHGGAGVVQRGLGAQPLGQHVLDAGQFEHGADRTARDHPGAGGGRPDQHAGGAVAAVAEGGDRTGAGEGHLDQMLLAVGDALADGADDVAGLADPDAHLAALVADDDDGPEAHLLAALDGLGDAADLHHPLLPFGVALLAATAVAPAATAAAVALGSSPRPPPPRALLLLAFGRGGDVGGRRHGAGLDLVVGFGHGERRDQN